MESNASRPSGSPRLSSSRPQIGFRAPRLRFEARLAGLLALLVAAALAALAVTALVRPMPIALRAAVLGITGAIMLWTALAAFRHVVRPLQTLSNVVAALRENEYSFRAREAGKDDAMGDLAAQINELAGDLRLRRHRETETFALLEQVVETMDLPVFAFDDSSRLQLTNPAACRMLQRSAGTMLQMDAGSLGLTEILHAEDKKVVAFTIRGRESRWMVRRSRFYQNAMPHTLLLLSDVSGVLREQERQAWQRLIRVLAHEVNNSLAPIKSIAGSLRSALQRSHEREQRQGAPPLASGLLATERPSLNPVDLEHGLAIIEERAESLNHFLQAYSQLAKLPPPVKSKIALGPLLARVCHLETRFPVALEAEEDIWLEADAAQLEQALINLVRNAVDAAMQAHASDGQAQIRVKGSGDRESVSIVVQDNGTGLANPANLFIPFYTTKAGGTGIGLILALQIVEAHGGTLTLANRESEPGCCAAIRLPTGAGVEGS